MKRKKTNIGKKSVYALRRSRARAKETPEQREKRLNANRLSQAARRAAETIEQREIRLLADRMRTAAKRAHERRSKNKEKNARRLEADRARIAARRASETLEEREKRLLSERMRQAARRAAETVEERERRLLANRIRIRALREAAKKNCCKAVCEKVKGHAEKLNKRKNISNQVYQNYQNLANAKNFILYSDSGMPVLNYSGNTINYSTLPENALKLSAYILVNTDGSCYSGENEMAVPEEVFSSCDNNQQILFNDVENVSLCFPVCEVEESTEIITPD